ncbi:MAG: homing endonuclease associated repeat-containing protein [Thermoleophilia bacterium]
MQQIYSDQDLLDALKREGKKHDKDGMMGPTYHGYLAGKNKPSAEAIRARFGGWTTAVRKAGMIPAARRTKDEMKKLVKLGKVDAKYPALRMGMSVRELKVSVGLEKPRKPTRERYIDEGARIARKLGRAPNFHEFNRYTKTVTAWNPYRLYGRDWKAFKRDVEKKLKEKEKAKAAKPKTKAVARKATKPKKTAVKAKAKAKPKAKARPKAKAKARR